MATVRQRRELNGRRNRQHVARFLLQMKRVVQSRLKWKKKENRYAFSSRRALRVVLFSTIDLPPPPPPAPPRIDKSTITNYVRLTTLNTVDFLETNFAFKSPSRGTTKFSAARIWRYRINELRNGGINTTRSDIHTDRHLSWLRRSSSSSFFFIFISKVTSRESIKRSHSLNVHRLKIDKADHVDPLSNGG